MDSTLSPRAITLNYWLTTIVTGCIERADALSFPL